MVREGAAVGPPPVPKGDHRLTERTFETGGEILRVGSTVIVFDGNSQKKLLITSIGTKRVFIESPYGKPIPYGIADRKSQQGAYLSTFKTETEVAAELRRQVAKSRLRDLGVEARMGKPPEDGLSPYSTETLEQVAAILAASVVNKA